MGDLSDRMCEQGSYGPDSYKGATPTSRRSPAAKKALEVTPWWVLCDTVKTIANLLDTIRQNLPPGEGNCWFTVWEEDNLHINIEVWGVKRIITAVAGEAGFELCLHLVHANNPAWLPELKQLTKKLNGVLKTWEAVTTRDRHA